MGLQVFLQASGEEVGRVSDVFDGTGTHDLLRIQLAPAQLARLAAVRAAKGESEEGTAEEEGEEEEEEATEEGEERGAAGPRHVLLPFVKAMVPVVDLAARRMEVTPPEGLLELAAPSNLRRARQENRGKRERRRTRPRGQGAAAAGASSNGSSNGAASSPASE